MEQQFHFSPLGILLTLPLFFFIFFKVRRKSQSNSSTPNLPPGPWKLPLIGNFHHLVGSPLPHRCINELAKKYGPIMHLQLGEISTVVISSPEAAKKVMKDFDINFSERPLILAASIMLYDGKSLALAPYGDYWRQLRKISTMELFSSKRVQSFRSIREEEVSNFIKSISSKAGMSINLSHMMQSLSLGIIARAALGMKWKNEEAILQIILEFMEAAGGFSITDVFPSLKWLTVLSGMRSALERMHKKTDKMFDNIINEHGTCTKKTSEGDVDDLLDVLLKLQDSGNLEFHLTTDSIKAVITELFSAGSESSSTVVEWAMSELLKSPRVLKKAQDEVRQVFCETGYVDEIDLTKLTYLDSVIRETLRLHPPAPFIPRECREKCEIDGYEIPAKTRVVINAMTIGRDPNYWIEADKFHPERFLDSSIDYKGTNFEFIPFGAGRRMCPGMMFGMATVELTLAKLLFHFDWELPNGAKSENLDMSEKFGVTIRRQKDLILIPSVL